MGISHCRGIHTIHCSCKFRPDLPFLQKRRCFAGDSHLPVQKYSHFEPMGIPCMDDSFDSRAGKYYLHNLTRHESSQDQYWMDSSSREVLSSISGGLIFVLKPHIKSIKSISLQFSLRLTEQRFFFFLGGGGGGIHSTVDCALSFLGISIRFCFSSCSLIRFQQSL